MNNVLDPNLNAFRADLADITLKDKVVADRYVDGWKGHIVPGITPVFGIADIESDPVTYFHHGEIVNIFEIRSGFSWCQAIRDGYVGYIKQEDVCDKQDDLERNYIINMGSYTYRKLDLRNAPSTFLPRHSIVAISERGLVVRDTLYARLSSGHYIPETCLGATKSKKQNVVSSARSYCGSPYLWGGRSYIGIDCAGLVQNVCEDIGISVLRDTYMQKNTIGIDSGPFSLSSLQAGDFLYIPGHVMIYTGDGTIIHADGSSMNVVEESIEQFLFERNISKNTLNVRRLT
jgi:cell wall-associated NlpC family hydrolase